MKTIPNKTTTIQSGKDTFVTYADLIKSVVNTPVEQGMTIEEVKKRVRILQAVDVDTAEKDFYLEDADHRNLIDYLDKMKWGMAHPDIVKFDEDIRNAASPPTQKQ